MSLSRRGIKSVARIVEHSQRRAVTTTSRVSIPASTSSSHPNRATRQPQQHRQNGRPFDDSYMLADRIKLLSSRNQLDAAVDLVKRSPAQIANVVCWNVLVNACLQHKQYKLAYDVWMDMKRRGVRPTTRSYSTFLAGFAKMKSSGTSTAVPATTVAKVKTVHAQWLVHCQRVLAREEKPGYRRITATEDESVDPKFKDEAHDTPEELSPVPTNHYLAFLSHINDLPLVLETFGAMPSSGPLAPNSVTYSIVLSALRTLASDSKEHFDIAMALWKRMRDQLDPSEIGTQTVSLMISLCREAKRPDDQRIGLEVAKEYYGLVDPVDEAKLVNAGQGKGIEQPKVMMDSGALSNVLSLVLGMQQYNLVARWFDQVRDYPDRFGVEAIDHHPSDLVLVALAAKHDASAAEGENLSADKLGSYGTDEPFVCPSDLLNWMRRSKSSTMQPQISTYTNALQVCWRAADLTRAYRILTLMTGRPVGPEMSLASNTSNEAEATPANATRSKHDPKSLDPDDRILSTLLQTALATRDRGHIYRAVCLLDPADSTSPGLAFARPATYFSTSTSESPSSSSLASRISKSAAAQTHAAYWRFRLGESLARSLERVLQAGEGHLTAARRSELSAWRTAVDAWLAEREGREGMRAKRLGIAKAKAEGDLRKTALSSGGEREEESMRGRWDAIGFQLRDGKAERVGRGSGDGRVREGDWPRDGGGERVMPSYVWRQGVRSEPRRQDLDHDRPSGARIMREDRDTNRRRAAERRPGSDHERAPRARSSDGRHRMSRHDGFGDEADLKRRSGTFSRQRSPRSSSERESYTMR